MDECHNICRQTLPVTNVLNSLHCGYITLDVLGNWYFEYYQRSRLLDNVLDRLPESISFPEAPTALFNVSYLAYLVEWLNCRLNDT